MTASEDSGRYCLDFDRTPQDDGVGLSEEVQTELKLRIATFLQWLEQQNNQPKLIVVCRSRFSGYTPKAHWPFVEQNLAEGLKRLYRSELTVFDEALRTEYEGELTSEKQSREGLVTRT